MTTFVTESKMEADVEQVKTRRDSGRSLHVISKSFTIMSPCDLRFHFYEFTEFDLIVFQVNTPTGHFQDWEIA